MKASVYSVYTGNVDSKVLEVQKKVVEHFLPEGWTFEQYQYSNVENDSVALDSCVKKNKNEIIVFLDIDCIPLNEEALPELAAKAKEDTLIGAIQRANHIDNKGHLYVGPFCMAFKVAKYQELGSPSFIYTNRGDRGEELTYKWEDANLPVTMMWPSHVELPMWALKNGIMFGLGTTYDGNFYHSFGIRESQMHDRFIQKCNEIIQSIPEKKAPDPAPEVQASKEIKPRAVPVKKVQPIREEAKIV